MAVNSPLHGAEGPADFGFLTCIRPRRRSAFDPSLFLSVMVHRPLPTYPDSPRVAHLMIPDWNFSSHGTSSVELMASIVADSEMKKLVEAAVFETGTWLEEADYAGQDPYQIAAKANATAQFAPLRPLLDLIKPVVKWLHPHLPSAIFRNMPAVVIPQALAYALSAEALAPESADRVRRIERIVQLLEVNKSPYTKAPAWGLPFTWRDGKVYPPHWPVAFSSAVVGNALIDARELLPVGLIEQWVRGLTDFLVDECGVLKTSSGLCFRFVKDSDSPIINGNALVAAFLARAGALLEDNNATTLAREAMAFVVNTQNSDGSWFYTAPHQGNPADRIIDNRHSLYILDGLALFSKADPRSGLPIGTALAGGWDYYAHELLTDGVTKWSPTTTYPIDGHDMAQAIITTSLLGKSCERDELMRVVLEKFYAGHGKFNFKLLESGDVNEAVFIRWTQAPFYKALRMYLHDGV